MSIDQLEHFGKSNKLVLSDDLVSNADSFFFYTFHALCEKFHLQHSMYRTLYKFDIRIDSRS